MFSKYCTTVFTIRTNFESISNNIVLIYPRLHLVPTESLMSDLSRRKCEYQYCHIRLRKRNVFKYEMREIVMDLICWCKNDFCSFTFSFRTAGNLIVIFGEVLIRFYFDFTRSCFNRVNNTRNTVCKRRPIMTYIFNS